MRLLAIPFIDPIDLRYSNRIKVPKAEQPGRDVLRDGRIRPMDENKKDIAKRFFILLYLFLPVPTTRSRSCYPSPHVGDGS